MGLFSSLFGGDRQLAETKYAGRESASQAALAVAIRLT